MRPMLRRSWAAHGGGALLGWLLVLSARLQVSGGQQDDGVQVHILYPAPQDVVPTTAAIELRCRFRGLHSLAYSAAIAVDEQDGGEFPIDADGEYTFTVPPLADGVHDVAVILMREGVISSRQTVSFQSSSTQQSPPPAPPPPPPSPPPPQTERPPPQPLAQAEDAVPTLAITVPAQCQVLAMSRLRNLKVSRRLAVACKLRL